MAKKKKQTKVKKKKDNLSIEKIIYVLISVVLAIFIFMSNLGLCGIVGSYVKVIVLSTFGSFGFFLPFIFLIGIALSLLTENANSKISGLIILYISIIGIFSIATNNIIFEGDLLDVLLNDIEKSKSFYFFYVENFSSGLIISFFNFILYKAISSSGLFIVYLAIALISFLYAFGLSGLSFIKNIFIAIISFIPNLINSYKEKKKEDKRIEEENEKLLKKHLAERKKTFEEVEKERNESRKKYDNIFDNQDYLLDDKKKNNVVMDEDLKKVKLANTDKFFNTNNIKINANDIRERFFNIDEKEKNVETKEDLLNDLKNKSINEILNEKKDIDSSSFYYIDENKKNFSDIEIDENVFNNLKKESLIEDNKADIKEEIKENIEDISESYEKLDDSLKNALEEVSTKDKPKINTKKSVEYKFPPLSYLNKTTKLKLEDRNYIKNTIYTLENTFKQFGVGLKVINISQGPTVTRFELQPEQGVRVKKILDLEDDIKLAIAATDIRIEAPIPGKAAIGIEIPNKETNMVCLGDIIGSNEFKEKKSKITFAVGKDLTGKIITCDLAKLPHLLVAGATGSGKSVCINSIIMSIIYKASPKDVRLILVDPKVVELQVYNNIPHLLIPVVTDPKKAASALNWAVSEMMRRYHLIVEKKYKDIESYNEFANNYNRNVEEDKKLEILPKIVIIIDEFADLMMVASKEVENAIFRIAQLARACGIHLVIATQRPSVNVISGSIKANVPGRIAFYVTNAVDSKTILDQSGAQNLLGKGDMLYYPTGIPKPIRVQGCFVSDEEIKKVVDFIKSPLPSIDEDIDQKISENAIDSDAGLDSQGKDEYFFEAGKLVITADQASAGFLQRKLQVGFNRASRILDQLATEGVITKQDGKKPREILLTLDEFISRYKK